MRSEVSILVGDDFVGSTIVWENMLDIEVGDVRCGSYFMAGNEDGSF